jgi:hypothetical protein
MPGGPIDLIPELTRESQAYGAALSFRTGRSRTAYGTSCRFCHQAALSPLPDKFVGSLYFVRWYESKWHSREKPDIFAPAYEFEAQMNDANELVSPQVYRLSEIATMLKVSRAQALKLAEAGAFPTINVGIGRSTLRAPKEGVHRYLRGERTDAAG